MKIGINARCLEYGLSGIERYTLELAKYFAASDDIERIDLFSQRELDVGFSSNKIRNISSSVDSPSALSKFKWESWTIANLASCSNLDVFHAPSFTLPFKNFSSRKKVITVHDLAFLKLPYCFDIKTRLYFKALLKKSLEQADTIICISEATKIDLVSWFPDSERKIAVVHNGYENFSNYQFDDLVLSNYSLEKMNYWLSVGTINPRKNLARIVEAFDLSDKHRGMKLVLVGNKDNLPDQIKNNPSVVVTGFISDNDLANLYRCCFGFLFPSLYEGFGFPILEAMSFGKPVVCSNSSSIPEVSAYSQELLVNPLSIDSISMLMSEIVMDDGLYKALEKHAYDNVKRFSWEKMASQTLNCYR